MEIKYKDGLTVQRMKYDSMIDIGTVFQGRMVKSQGELGIYLKAYEVIVDYFLRCQNSLRLRRARRLCNGIKEIGGTKT